MRPHIIHLDIQTFTAYQRLMLKGIINYWHQHRPGWRFASDHWPPADRAKRIEELRGVEGVLTHNPDPESTEALRSKRVPVVSIEQDPETACFPTVNADNDKIARMAFEHLRNKGLRQFSSSNGQYWPMMQRAAAFEQAVRQAGQTWVTPFTTLTNAVTMGPAVLRPLRQWVKALPKPIGLFATTAGEAWRIVLICNELGIHVPNEVAVIGCNKDPLTCDLIHPPLSTVDHGMEAAGYEAAALLHRLIEGHAPPAEPILIPPIGVVERQSTDILLIDDPNVREAVYFIRENAMRGITPADVVDQVLVGRRRLEIRFKELVGRTIQQQIVEERISQAKHLLANTDLPLIQIARRCCFEHVSRLSESFSRVVGVPPSVYRRKHAQSPAGE